MTDNQQGKLQQRQSSDSVPLDQAQIARLEDALDRLRPRDRAIFLAACRQEAPHAEIAARHRCSIAMVRRIIARVLIELHHSVWPGDQP